MAGVSIRKALPPSYTSSFAFEQPRNPAFFSLGEDFGCSVRAKDPKPLQPPPPKTVSWGQIISYALRQPQLATALGLVYTPLQITPVAADVVRRRLAVCALRSGVESLRRRPGCHAGPRPDVCGPDTASKQEQDFVHPSALPGQRESDGPRGLRRS